MEEKWNITTTSRQGKKIPRGLMTMILRQKKVGNQETDLKITEKAWPTYNPQSVWNELVKAKKTNHEV